MIVTLQDAKGWLVRHKWAVAFVLTVAGGYIIGKDLALRDNIVEMETGGVR